MCNFELGKTYIVDVTANGIIPLMEFDESRWYDKDLDELDFLTDEEKIVVINKVLGKIKAEIEEYRSTIDRAISEDELKIEGMKEAYTNCLEIIGKYKAESDGE